MSCDHELANEWARCSGKNASYITIQLISNDFGVQPNNYLNLLFDFLHRQEYVSELFHYLQTSADSPQLLALLESFLFSVVRDVKHYSSENQRLEDALKRYTLKPFVCICNSQCPTDSSKNKRK